MSFRKIRSESVKFFAPFGLTRYKYFFIHIPKNAGMTIFHAPQLKPSVLPIYRRYLKSTSYAKSLLQAMNEVGDHPGYAHARLRDIKPAMRRNLQGFAVIRNPWARVVSRYTFARTAIQNGKISPDYCADTFEGFLDERHIWGDKDYFWHRAVRGWYPQRDYIVDENGKIAVDILRLDRLDDELRTYFNIDTTFKKRNISNVEKTDYRDFYNDRTIQIVADWYKADIDMFGFDFDTGAKCNTYFSSEEEL